MERFTIIGRQPDNYLTIICVNIQIHCIRYQINLLWKGGMVEIIGQSIDVCISQIKRIYKCFLLFLFDAATEAFMFDLNRTACR